MVGHFSQVRVALFLGLLAIHAAAGDLPRVRLLTPQEELATFQLAPDLRIELVAAEPQVASPVDLCFDEEGRMYVAEMLDYPFSENPPRGRVSVLEDADGDGRFERAAIFCDGLAWPTAVAASCGGVFVAAAPSIWFLKDTDGDRKADIKEEVFTGFGRGNVQALLNNIKWSIENCFVCASGGNGGKIRSLRRAGGAELSLSGRDFMFRPSGECDALSGGGQFGNTLDDFGRRFVCNNSVQARHVVLEDHYLRRNPFLPVSSALASIAADGDSGPVFRISPVEPWRAARTQMRLAGAAPGPIEHGGKVTGYFTSATGITVYRNAALGPKYYSNLFIGDVAGNLVHRKMLSLQGATFRADRVEFGSEFLASTDNAFRPANFAGGPDGALYVCDIYRECIEHPLSIPESLKQQLDLKAGSDRGRIWRVTAKDAAPSKRPALRAASASELADLLRHPDGWWRDTAARLIYERQDRAAVPTLEKLARDDERPATRAAALWALNGMSALPDGHIAAALRDASPDVREQALRLAESRLGRSPELRAQILAMDEQHPRARFQLALTLGEIDDPTVADALARLSVHAGGDQWLRTAILTSAAKCAADLLRKSDGAGPEFIRELAQMIGARSDSKEMDAVLSANKSWTILAGLADGVRRGGGRLIEKRPELKGDFDAATAAAKDNGFPDSRRVEAIRLLEHADRKTAQATLAELLADPSPPVQGAALRALIAFSDESVGDYVIGAWKSLAPVFRQEALGAWFNRPGRLGQLMASLENGAIVARELTPDIRGKLRAQFKDRARGLIEDGASDRKLALEQYRAALALTGDTQRGRAVYQQACMTCHRAAGEGKELGPDLETVAHRSPEELLAHILDPNREIQPQYHVHVITTRDGRVLDGMLSSQNANSVTLKRALGETSVVLRSEIQKMLSSAVSPMPEGLESSISVEKMADLIAFIRSLAKKQ